MINRRTPTNMGSALSESGRMKFEICDRWWENAQSIPETAATRQLTINPAIMKIKIGKRELMAFCINCTVKKSLRNKE